MEIGLPRFLRHFACPAVLRYHIKIYSILRYGVFTLFDNSFQNFLLIFQLFIYDPTTSRQVGIWAFPFSLTATCGIFSSLRRSFVFFSSGYLDVSVPQLTHHRFAESPNSKLQSPNNKYIWKLKIGHWKFRETVIPTAFTVRGFPIRTSSDRSLLTAPRHISPSSASFFGFSNQGIHYLL